MVWTDELKDLLLSCETDEDLVDNFPTYRHRLSTLKRRRREFRNDRPDEEQLLKERLGKIADLLDDSGIPVEEIARVKQVRLNAWQGMYKDNAGEAQIVDMEGAAIVLEPKWAEGPAWPVVQYAAPVRPEPIRRIPRPTRFKTAVILPDPQIGFRRDMVTDKLDPFHDERAMNIGLQVVRDVQPHKIVNLGDMLDLSEQGKFIQEPAFQRTTQPAIDRSHLFLAEQVDTAPDDCEIELLEGNHCRRMHNYIMHNAGAAFAIQRANLPESWPVMSVPNLLRVEDLGVKYLPGYPANITWINDNLACIHGSKVKSTGSTAAQVIDDERVSVIFGHIHRIEQQYKTRSVRAGARTNFAVSPGCLCRIDGAVPSVKGSTDPFGRPVTHFENWQQGLAVVNYIEGDGPFSVDTIHIHDGYAIYQGEEYVANV
jgi:hypothetical protein